MLLRVEDTDRERSSSELVENILASLRWLGLEWDGDIVFQADNLEAHREAALSLLGDGRGVLVRLHRGADPGAGQGARRPARLRRPLPRPRPRAERRHRPPLPGPRRRHHLLHRRRAGRGDLREQDDRGLRAPAVHRHADVPALQRVRRRRDGDHPRRARRGPRAGHAQVPPAPRCARPRPARGVRPPADARERGPQEALEAQGRGVGGRLRGRGLPARGDGQLPRPARLGPARRRRDPAARGDRRAVPARGRHLVAGVLRREEAAAHQRRVHPGPAHRRVPPARPPLPHAGRRGRRRRSRRSPSSCRSGCGCSARSSR